MSSGSPSSGEKSSGPSPGPQNTYDPLVGFGGASDPIGPVPVDPASAIPGSEGPSPPSISSSYAQPVQPLSSIFSYSTPLEAPGPELSGPGDISTANPFATISNPSGVPLGTSGVYAAEPTALGSDTSAGGGPTSTPAIAGGLSGVTAPPAGVSSTISADPTQQQQVTQAQAPQKSTGFSLESLFSGIGKSVASNPMGFLGGLGMAYNAYQQNKAMQGIPKLGASTAQLEQQASQLNAQGQQLATYLTSGNLPEGLKASLEQATKAAKANIISNFAQRGQQTDPTKNSVLAQELAAVDAQAVISTAQMGQQLMATGLQETGMSSDLYKTLAQIDQSQTAQINKSIANFASALSPTKSMSLKLG